MTLSLFGLTIVVSIGLMVVSISYFTHRGRQDRVAVDPLLMWASAAASYIFVTGVGAFMLFLLDLPLWALAFVIVALLLLARSVRAYFRRRRASESKDE